MCGPTANLNVGGIRGRRVTQPMPGRPTGVTGRERPRHRPVGGEAGTPTNLCRETRSDPCTKLHGPRTGRKKETEEANEQRVRHALVLIDFFVFTKPILNPYNPFASLTYSFRHNSTRRGARFRPHRSSFAISPREYDRSFASPLSISNVPTPVVELVRRTRLFSNPLSLLTGKTNRYPLLGLLTRRAVDPCRSWTLSRVAAAFCAAPPSELSSASIRATALTLCTMCRAAALR